MNYRDILDSPDHVLQWKAIGRSNNVTGYCISGELFAFLGISSSKSSLLRQIAGQKVDYSAKPLDHLQAPYLQRQKRSHDQSSTITYNGKCLYPSSPPSPSATSSSSASSTSSQWQNIPSSFAFLQVSYTNNLYENLTVLELLTFSAELRIENPAHPSDLSAMRLLSEMNLEELTYIKFVNLNTWQKRLILFATEVIALRNVIFFEEPTVDLDATSALSLINSLQNCAKR